MFAVLGLVSEKKLAPYLQWSETQPSRDQFLVRNGLDLLNECGGISPRLNGNFCIWRMVCKRWQLERTPTAGAMA